MTDRLVGSQWYRVYSSINKFILHYIHIILRETELFKDSEY